MKEKTPPVIESYAMIKIKYYKVITELQSPIHRTNSDGQAVQRVCGCGCEGNKKLSLRKGSHEFLKKILFRAKKRLLGLFITVKSQ